MKIATASSRWSTKWKTAEWTWTQLVDRLRTPKRTKDTVREYHAMDKDGQAKCKDVGGFVGGAINGGRRVGRAVEERWLVTLDEDYAEHGDWETVTCINEWACCVYSTHSHTPSKPRLRWIIPLSRAVTPEEYVAVARKVAYNTGLIERLDPTTYEPERLMFWPSVCADGEYVFHEQKGEPLDPDEVLAEYGDGDAWKDVSLWPTSRREGELIRKEERRQQADPTTKENIIGAFCRVYDIHDAIQAFDLPYEVCDNGGVDPISGTPTRYTYTEGSTAGGAVVYEGKWLYSHHATDPASGQLCNAWDLVRIHRFGDLDEGKAGVEDSTKLPSYKAMLGLATGDPTVKGEQIDSQFGDLGSIAPVSAGSVTHKTDDGDGAENDGDKAEDEDDAWKTELTLDKKGRLEPSLNNACLILRNAPQFRGKLGYCNRDKLVYVIGDLPWTYHSNRLSAEEEKLIMGPQWMTDDEIYAQKGYHGPPRTHGRVWSTQDRTSLYKFFERWNYSVMQTTNGGLDKAVVDAAQETPFDPLRDYLIGLKWDGKKRVEDMFIRWLGAEDCDLNREITRLWMMGAVDRAMRPGCQFDSVLVFCGEQGIGKTSMLRMLAGEYYTNAVDVTSMTKATAELLQGKWIVELGELDSIKKSSITSFKNFISATTDHYRKAYATDAETYPRRCAFAATTNEGAFLRDGAGRERRFWIMPCAGQKGMNEIGKKGTLPGFAGEVEQLWAEAVDMWRRRMREKRRGGEALDDINLYLFIQDPALEDEMEERRQGFKLPDVDREYIEDYLDRLRPDDWDDWSPDDRAGFFSEDGLRKYDPDKCTYQLQVVTRKEILTELYDEDPKRVARGGRSSMATRVQSLMDSLPGWRRDGTAKRDNDRSTLWRRVGAGVDE